MKYEETIIAGVLHYRFISEEKWEPMNATALTTLLTASRETNNRLRETIANYDDAISVSTKQIEANNAALNSLFKIKIKIEL